ncbi:MAG: hypothetical protein ACYC3W_10540, partial [Candidatus Nanopelagicales bacterium]
MKILSIDPALTTGIAVYDDGDHEFEVWDMHESRKISLGRVYNDFYRERLKSKYGLDMIVYENATPQSNHSAEVQYALISLAQMYATELDIPYYGYYPGTIKAHARKFIEEHCSPRDIGEMALMFNRVRANKLYTCMYFYYQHEFLPQDHNVADANALL